MEDIKGLCGNCLIIYLFLVYRDMFIKVIEVFLDFYYFCGFDNL